jgi:ABC-2 type transport system permease protein
MTSATHHGAHGVRREPERAPRGAEAASSPHDVAPRIARGAHPRRTVLSLYSRLTRRSALLMAAGVAVYVGIEVASYRAAYPNGVSPLQFAMFEDNPAVRMMQGAPIALDSAGGFTVWDGGWMIQLLVAVWAILTTSRLLRGEEDVERTDLVLAGPIRAIRATALSLVVVATAALLIGIATAAAMLASGTGLQGSMLLGLGLAGVTATFASVAAVTSQLVNVRRRAAAVAAGVLAVAYILRIVGNSTDARSWVRWTTPLGWMDELKPYGDPDLRALLPMLIVPILLAGLAVALRARRDTGGALLANDAGREPNLRLLGSPAAFAWRSNRAVLLGWVVGLGAYAAVMGALISTMIDWLAQDQSYQQIMGDLGLDEALTTQGFLAMIGIIFGVAVALQVAWRIGAARDEEESGRVEAVLARPVSRLRWLGGHALLSLLGGVLLLAATGTALWLGVAASGSGETTWDDAMRSVLNTLPVVVLTGGLAVFSFGLLPRLTVAIPVTVTVVGYIVTLVGPALSWPAWVLNMSPFTHLAWVPAVPWAATAGIVLTCLGLVLTAAGLLAFHRRDVVGS